MTSTVPRPIEASVRSIIAVLILSATAAAEPRLSSGQSLPPLHEAVTNNAVASITTKENAYLISFAGLADAKGHNDTHGRTFVFNERMRRWSEADAIPGGQGRLAAVAATVGDRAFVFGGYTVAEDGSEVSTPWVHAFSPESGTFEQRAPMPVPVDDAVAVAYADRYIFLISGWHDFGNVNLVQRYDTKTDKWVQATPTPGPGVFGHAGGIVDNQVVYCDGVAIEAHSNRRRKFVAVNNCFLGIIDKDDSRRIDWRLLPAHPGKPRYRMAAAGMDDGVLFIGGSDNPYNYTGIGYDGKPSEPVSGALLFNTTASTWQALKVERAPTMDHRGLVPFAGGWVTIGGMIEKQQVTGKVNAYDLDRDEQAPRP